MTTSLSDAELRVEQERLLAAGRSLHVEAMQVIRLAEQAPLPKDIRDSIYEFKQLLARADIVYGAARNLKQYLETMEKTASAMRDIAGQTFGVRADEMRVQANSMDRLTAQVQNEYKKAIEIADGYETRSKEAQRNYNQAKAAHWRRYGDDAPDYDDFLIQKMIVEREMAEDAKYFDWDEYEATTGDY